MQLSLGQTYHEADLVEATTRLQDALREEGLYEAKLEVEKRARTESHQLDVIVHVNSGQRVRLSKIELLNNTEYRDGDLLALFKVKAGRELTIARVRAGEERITEISGEKRASERASVCETRGIQRGREYSIPLTIEVTEGPRVLVQVEGAKFSKRDLKKLVPIYQEGSVDTDLLEEGKRNLRERMERDGYFDANVSYSMVSKEIEGAKTGWKGSEETITYKVDRGDRHKLLRDRIPGKQIFQHVITSEPLEHTCEFMGDTAKIQPAIDGERRAVDEESVCGERISVGESGRESPG